jgi:hypothetical protein
MRRDRWTVLVGMTALFAVVPSNAQAQAQSQSQSQAQSQAQAQEGFRAWVGLYDPVSLGWLENENRIGEFCPDPAAYATCHADRLAPAISIFPLHREASATSSRIGDLLVAAVPGRGLSAHFRAADSRRTVPFEPDVYLQDWGYGPYFHQTVLAQRGSWFKLPAGPWDGSVWIDRGDDGERSLIRVQAGDILELAGEGHYVVEAEPNVLVLRPEQPADLWCEGGDPPAVAVSEPRRVAREALSDSIGRLLFRPRHMKGC